MYYYNYNVNKAILKDILPIGFINAFGLMANALLAVAYNCRDAWQGLSEIYIWSYKNHKEMFEEDDSLLKRYCNDVVYEEITLESISDEQDILNNKILNSSTRYLTLKNKYAPLMVINNEVKLLSYYATQYNMNVILMKYLKNNFK